MSTYNARLIASASVCFALFIWSASAKAQPTPPLSAATSEAEQKAALLDSECWRRSMFELNQWYRSQTIFTPAEVEQQKADFAARVDKMSVKELKEVISDLETKFRILDTPQVQEVRTWFGQYLAVLANRRREELLRDIPNFATMTPSQLNQEIMKIQRKKLSKRSSQAAFDQGRQARIEAMREAEQAAQAARQARAARRAAYRSPYRPAPSVNQPAGPEVGRRNRMSIDPNGNIWRHLDF
jgi:hypothetical protein